MMNQKSVKYYFDDQIRRFSVDVPADGTGVFVNLTNKIVSMYPDVPVDELQLGWRDSDNELISLGSDEDLKEALKDGANAEVLRVFGNLKTKSTGGYGSVPLHRQRRHHHGGPGPFGRPFGPPGFSLRNFAGMGINPTEPPTAAAAAPLTTPPVQPQTTPTPEDPTLHKGVTCDGCEQPVRNRRYKCAVCPDYDLCEACEGRHLHDQHSMIRIADPKDGSWRRVFMGRGGCPFRGPRGPVPPPPPFGPEMFAQFAQAAMGQQQQQQQGGTEANNNAPTQFLKNVGENIAAILSNFGIDVDVDVEHNGKREKVAKEPTTEPTAQPTADETVVVSPSPVPSAPVAMETSTTADSTPALAPTVVPPTEANWTFVDRSDVSYPNVTQLMTSSIPQDPKITSALALMTSMGFTNEGGWLTNLIESKGGDINAVLDTLNPSRRN